MTPSPARINKRKKNFSGWFRPLGTSKRTGTLLFCLVEIKGDLEARAKQRIIISVPKSCGNAVKRNRFRRMVKAFVQRNVDLNSGEWPLNRGIWIRLSKSFTLDSRIVVGDWKENLRKILFSLGVPS